MHGQEGNMCSLWSFLPSAMLLKPDLPLPQVTFRLHSRFAPLVVPVQYPCVQASDASPAHCKRTTEECGCGRRQKPGSKHSLSSSNRSKGVMANVYVTK